MIRGQKTEDRKCQSAKASGFLCFGAASFIFLSFVFCLLPSVLSGCGYTTRSFVNPKMRTIYIQPFVNKINIASEFSERRKYKTYFPLLEAKITREVVNRFIFDGNLRIAKPEKADVVLTGELIDYLKQPLKYKASDNATIEEYRLNLIVNIKLSYREGGEVVWEEKGFVGDTTYFTSGPSAKSESSALTLAITDLARRIVERTIEQW
ncbi:MAG: LPS assembly lipoprotein LptE [Candidatus Omnitrophota bacterium]